MSTSAYSSEYDTQAPVPYRAVSKSAVASLAIAAISLIAAAFPALLVIPVLGAGLGLMALLNIRRYPKELTGWFVGVVGLTVCSTIFIVGAGYHLYVYNTEVPEGYLRISFFKLQPDPAHPEIPVPPLALEWDGKKVFIKGYVYPDGQQGGIKRFVLVPDMGTCCFGGQPKLTDMVQVTLKDPYSVEYSRRLRKLGGILKVNTKKKPVNGLDGVYYQLEADYLK